MRVRVMERREQSRAHREQNAAEKMHAADFEDGGRGHKSRNVGNL